MSHQMIRPVFDPECRRVFHVDRQGAQAQLVAMEVWNRATGRDLQGRRMVVFRCPRCGGFHVATRFVRTHAVISTTDPAPNTTATA